MTRKPIYWPKGILAMLAAHAITLAIFFAIIRCAIAVGIQLSHRPDVFLFIDEDDDNFVLYWAAVLVVGACVGFAAIHIVANLLTRRAVADPSVGE
jgi:uncharacterized BrkB/YihY/UPF0761 family membrane protein